MIDCLHEYYHLVENRVHSIGMECYVNKTLEGPRDTVELSFQVSLLFLATAGLITPLTVSSWYAEMLIRAKQLLQPGYGSPDLAQYRCIYTICYCMPAGEQQSVQQQVLGVGFLLTSQIFSDIEYLYIMMA